MTANKTRGVMASPHQNSLNDAWDTFLASLTEADRHALRQAGISGPLTGNEMARGGDNVWEAERPALDGLPGGDALADLERKEALEQLAAAVEVLTVDGVLETLLALRPHLVTESIQAAFRLFICEFAGCARPQLELDCLARAVELPMGTGEGTLRGLGLKHGCTHQNVAKREEKWRNLLGLGRASHQKRAEASEAYRLRNRRNYTVPRGTTLHVEQNAPNEKTNTWNNEQGNN